MIIVFVCGSRDFSDSDLTSQTLDAIVDGEEKVFLIHGAATGADSLASSWARANKIQQQPFYADWKMYGKAAGPIRNKEMLDELELRKEKGDKIICFAFKSNPVSIGTDHMISILEKNDFEVTVVKEYTEEPVFENQQVLFR